MCADNGLSKNLMTELKSGRKKGINAETANKLASYFGVTVAYLIGVDDQPEKKQPTTPEDDELAKLLEDPETREFYELIKDFSDEELEDLLKYAEFMISKREKKSKQ